MKRIVFLDFVRVFACFLVILVHASENFYPGPGATDMAGPQSLLANELDRLCVSLYDGFGRISVPLFIIVSAYLLVPMKENESMWSFYRRRALRILPPFLCFMVLYSTLPLLWGQIDQATSLRDLLRLPLNFPTLAGHLWFMYPLFSIYLFTPMISPWLRKAKPREELFFIAIFAISTCMPYIIRLFGEIWGQCFWNEYHMLWYFSGYLGYVVLAHYIRVHLTWSNRQRLTVGALLLAIGSAATIYSFYIQAIPGIIIDTPQLEIGWAFCTINVLTATAGAFLMFSTIGQKEPHRIITETSKLSYGMYLMHIFWLGYWVGILKNDMALSSDIAIPAIAVATFLSSLISCKIISYIPGAKWIIGAGRGFGQEKQPRPQAA